MTEDDQPEIIELSDDDPMLLEFEAEERQAAERKASLIKGQLSSGKISPELAKLLSDIKSATMGSAAANLRKVEAVFALRPFLSRRNVSKEAAIYVGAGLDWRFPVALGFRDITMLDSGYFTSNLHLELFADVASVDKAAKTDGQDIKFSMFWGRQWEAARLRLESSGIEEYIPASKFGTVLEYAGPTKTANPTRLPVSPNLVPALDPGALILNFDYDHEHAFSPELGLTHLEFSGFHVYSVRDRDQVMAQSGVIFRNPGPSLEAIRASLKAEEGNS